MTTIAGTALYAREYQRRRARGLPTKGLAKLLRDTGGEGVHLMPAVTRRRIEAAYARGLRTSQVMQQLAVTYSECQQVLEASR